MRPNCRRTGLDRLQTDGACRNGLWASARRRDGERLNQQQGCQRIAPGKPGTARWQRSGRQAGDGDITGRSTGVAKWRPDGNVGRKRRRSRSEPWRGTKPRKERARGHRQRWGALRTRQWSKALKSSVIVEKSCLVCDGQDGGPTTRGQRLRRRNTAAGGGTSSRGVNSAVRTAAHWHA